MSIFSRKKKEDKSEEKPQEKAVDEEAGEETKPSVKLLPKGGDARAYAAISEPYVTEKAGNMGALGKYTFKVSRGSNKFEIKKAIEKMYKVKVEKVAVVSMPAKTRRVGRREGKKPGFKKAIVTLIEGDKIDIVS